MRSVPLAAAVLLLAAGCGGSSEHDRHVIFEQNCAACHSISPGKPSPVAKALNLYDLHPSPAQVRRAITEGAPGMPRNLVKGDAVGEVVQYVQETTAR
ncbi:MAG TPA: cytochrome c [Gaiellales bacterium]|jgi:mono/diheme cytochrome c family protein|nr:cytochrome c [Gaiellales bacterium]